MAPQVRRPKAVAAIERLVGTPYREEKSVHNHHQKKIFWRTFLASKKNFPGWWWIQKPYKNHHIHHRNLSSVDPLFFCKEKFCTGAGRCMLSFSQPLAIVQSGPPDKPTPPPRDLEVVQQPLARILLQKYRDTNGGRIVIQIGGVYTTFFSLNSC